MVVGDQHHLTWPEESVADVNLTGWPILLVTVTTPRDQALLHRVLALHGYCPVLLDSTPEVEHWRFHHPDGPQP